MSLIALGIYIYIYIKPRLLGSGYLDDQISLKLCFIWNTENWIRSRKCEILNLRHLLPWVHLNIFLPNTLCCFMSLSLHFAYIYVIFISVADKFRRWLRIYWPCVFHEGKKCCAESSCVMFWILVWDDAKCGTWNSNSAQKTDTSVPCSLLSSDW